MALGDDYVIANLTYQESLGLLALGAIYNGTSCNF